MVRVIHTVDEARSEKEFFWFIFLAYLINNNFIAQIKSVEIFFLQFSHYYLDEVCLEKVCNRDILLRTF